MGHPAAFLRLQGCTLNCMYCDTQEVWREGNPYTFDELFDLMEHTGKPDLIDKLCNRQHLVLTGGSPMKQQLELINFIGSFIKVYGFKPFIEIENECTLLVNLSMAAYVDCWNNSPKLASSGNSRVARYKPNVLQQLSGFKNSCFKFVIECEEDWEEIQMDFLDPKLIKKKQIILMPEGADRIELEQHKEITVQMAIKHNVRYTTREHIVLWDKKTGI